MTEPLVRALAAGLMVLAYAAMCLAIWRRERRRRAADAPRHGLAALFDCRAGSAPRVTATEAWRALNPGRGPSLLCAPWPRA